MSMSGLSTVAIATLFAGAFVAHGGVTGATQSTTPESDQTRATTGSSQSKEAQETMARMKQREPAAQVRGKRPIGLTLVTSAGRITGTPAQFYGVPVSVHGQVARTFSPHVFTLEEDSWSSFGGNLPVLVPLPRPGAKLDANDFVTVTGTVRPFVRVEIERDYDWFDFDALPDLNANLEGRPVLIADAAKTSDGVVVAQPAQPLTRILLASAGEIADVPGRFYGETVSVLAEVENVWSPRLFTLDEDQLFAGPDVLVLNPNPAAGAGDLDNDRVTVLGTVRPFIVSEFEADYDWFNAGDYARFGLSSLERRPVIVASSILGENNREMVTVGPDITLDVVSIKLAPRAEQWNRTAAGARDRSGRDERGTTGTQTPQQQR